jgi:hypothetical protein
MRSCLDRSQGVVMSCPSSLHCWDKSEGYSEAVVGLHVTCVGKYLSDQLSSCFITKLYICRNLKVSSLISLNSCLLMT